MPWIARSVLAVLSCCLPAFVSAQASGAPVAAEVSFVAGRVQVAGEGAPRELAVGDVVRQGDRLVTGVGGHLHLRTVDKGFLALRPNTRARVEIYEFDPASPASTRIRLTLQSGVMRAVTGEGAQAARDRFRLNTPVAAIGIRGTDFTVSTDDTLTRAVVQRGAIAVAALGSDCRAEALGPCDGATVRALTAEQAGKLIELRRGQREPLLIDVRPGGGAPDQVAPPASSEPRASATPDRAVDPNGERVATLSTEGRIGGRLEAALAEVESSRASPPPAPAVHWGRWAVVAGQPAPVDPEAFTAANGRTVAANALFLLSSSRPELFQLPRSGTFDFRLDASESYVTQRGVAVAPAEVRQGALSVDFDRSRFATRLEGAAQGAAFSLAAQGVLGSDGRLSGNPIYTDGVTNMSVRGALGGTQGTTAAYLFSHTLDSQRAIVGAAGWSR